MLDLSISLNCFLLILCLIVFQFFIDDSNPGKLRGPSILYSASTLTVGNTYLVLLLCLGRGGGWCGQGTHHLTVLTLPSMFPSEATDTVVYLPTSQQNASLSNEEAVIFLNTPPKPSFGWCLAVFILKRQEITPCRWGKHDRGHHYSSVARRKSPQGAQKNEKLFFFATDVYWFVRFIGSTP